VIFVKQLSSCQSNTLLNKNIIFYLKKLQFKFILSKISHFLSPLSSNFLASSSSPYYLLSTVLSFSLFIVLFPFVPILYSRHILITASFGGGLHPPLVKEPMISDGFLLLSSTFPGIEYLDSQWSLVY
jgi:hypothetical protein